MASLTQFDTTNLALILKHVYADDLKRLLQCGSSILEYKMRHLRDVVVNVRQLTSPGLYGVPRLVETWLCRCAPIHSLVICCDKPCGVLPFESPPLNHRIIQTHAASLRYLKLRRICLSWEAPQITVFPLLVTFVAEHAEHLHSLSMFCIPALHGVPGSSALTTLHIGTVMPVSKSNLMPIPPNVTSFRCGYNQQSAHQTLQSIAKLLRHHETPLMDFCLTPSLSKGCTNISYGSLSGALNDYIFGYQSLDTDSDNCMIEPPSNVVLSKWVATCGNNVIDISMKCISEAASSTKEALRRSNGTVITSKSLLPTRHAFQARQGDRDHVLCCTNMPEQGTRRQLHHLTCRLNDERMDFQLFGNKQEPASRLYHSTLTDALYGTSYRTWIVTLKLTSPCTVGYDEISELRHLVNLTRLLITDVVLAATDSSKDKWALPNTITHLTLQNRTGGGTMRVLLNQVVVVPKSLIHLKLVAPMCNEMSSYCSAEATPQLQFLSVILSLHAFSMSGRTNTLLRQFWPKRWPVGLQSIVCQLPQGASGLNGGISPWPWNLGNLPSGLKSLTIAVHQYAAEFGQLLRDESGLLAGSGLPPSSAVVSIYGQRPDQLVDIQPLSSWMINRIRNGRQLNPTRVLVQDWCLLSIVSCIVGIICFAFALVSPHFGSILVFLGIVGLVFCVIRMDYISSVLHRSTPGRIRR